MRRINFTAHRTRLAFLIILMLALVAVMIGVFFQSKSMPAETASTERVAAEPVKALVEPKLDTLEVLAGLSHPWDVVFLPSGTLFFNERGGQVSKLQNSQKMIVANIKDVYAVGEGGLTGLALDPDFKTNRYLYTCFNARTAGGLDVRLVRWKLSADESKLEDRKDIITGIPSNASGRHSGCRVRSDKQGNLWVGTGDAAVASNPQDPKSLGGKILHVTRDGMPAGNSLPAPFDPRIFSYGHRNVQGIILFDDPRKDGVYGYSIEHGSDRDDEVNLLKNGNFGWAPRVTYVERGIPMTDTNRFPGAISAIWSSGSPTIAPSGGIQLKGRQWGTYNSALVAAVLKAQHLRLLQFDTSDKLVADKQIVRGFGRIRSAALGPDDNLYLATDNGQNDKIIKVTPSGN